MLRTSLEWRRENRVDYILDEFKPPEVLVKYFPCAPIGKDKLGNPLFLYRYGNMDCKGLFSSVTKEDYMKNIILFNENCVRLGDQEHSSSLVQSTAIYDMEGLSMGHITHKQNVEVSIEGTQIFDANYPELMKRLFIINAPWIVSVGYRILRPLVNEKTANKVIIYSHDQEEWKKALLEEIDADQLPACYGGTLTDPDGNPNCITKCPMGGTVPESYYLENRVSVD